jgi:hypothetical protein
VLAYAVVAGLLVVAHAAQRLGFELFEIGVRGQPLAVLVWTPAGHAFIV